MVWFHQQKYRTLKDFYTKMQLGCLDVGDGIHPPGKGNQRA
jgi:hypothetical protein